MRELSLRTIGASLVLLGLSVAALIQIIPAGDPDATSLIPGESLSSSLPSTEATTEPTPEAAVTTLEPSPFDYHVGVLAGVSTDNFWEFYGAQPSVWNSYILGPTKLALFRVDPVSSQLEPELAEAIPEPSYDGETWYVEVPIREDRAWSDGAPITARDLVFTFETARSLQLGGSWAAVFPEAIVKVEEIARDRVRIEFADRPTLAVWPHSIGTAPIMAEHVWGDLTAGSDAATLYSISGARDVSGGQLAIDEVAEGAVFSSANPGYGVDEGPDSVEYRIYPDESSMVDALTRGEIDAILTPKGLSPESSALLTASDVVEQVSSPANSIRYLGFNLEREPMTENAFRSALALLLERDALSDAIAGASRPAYTFVREANTLWHDPTRAAEIAAAFSGGIQTRLDRALSGLRDAGYSWATEPAIDANGGLTPGTGLTINGLPPAPLTILTPGDAYDSTRPAYVDAIVSTLAVLGFEARPVITDFDTVVDLAFTSVEEGARSYDMYLLGWTLGNPSLPDYYRPLFASTGAMNNTGYSSTEFDETLAAFEAASAIDEARDRLWDLEGILARDLPYLVLYTTDITEAFRSDRVTFGLSGNLGGMQGRLGGIGDVMPVSN